MGLLFLSLFVSACGPLRMGDLPSRSLTRISWTTDPTRAPLASFYCRAHHPIESEQDCTTWEHPDAVLPLNGDASTSRPLLTLTRLPGGIRIYKAKVAYLSPCRPGEELSNACQPTHEPDWMQIVETDSGVRAALALNQASPPSWATILSQSTLDDGTSRLCTGGPGSARPSEPRTCLCKWRRSLSAGFSWSPQPSGIPLLELRIRIQTDFISDYVRSQFDSGPPWPGASPESCTEIARQWNLERQDRDNLHELVVIRFSPQSALPDISEPPLAGTLRGIDPSNLIRSFISLR